jgi:hypothetical protein
VPPGKAFFCKEAECTRLVHEHFLQKNNAVWWQLRLFDYRVPFFVRIDPYPDTFLTQTNPLLVV